MMLFYLLLTLATYFLSKRLYRRTRKMIFSPLIVCPLILIVILLGFQVPYENYAQGGQWLTFMLQPATVALAVPVYKYRLIVRKYMPEILVSVFGGAAIAIITSVVIAHLVGMDSQWALTLAPRSVTMPIAMSVSSVLGGNPSITAVFVICTGITGTLLTSLFLRYVPVKSPVTCGMLYGVSAHGTGTAKAYEFGQIEGVIASLAMIFMGIVTTVIALPLVRLLLG